MKKQGLLCLAAALLLCSCHAPGFEEKPPGQRPVEITAEAAATRYH